MKKSAHYYKNINYINFEYSGGIFMKICTNCNYQYEENEKFCPNCGNMLIEDDNDNREIELDAVNNIACPNCNMVLNGDFAFCPSCGAKISENTQNEQNNILNSIGEVVNDVKNNDFIKSVKQDLDNSESINMVKDRVKYTSDKIKNADEVKKNKIKKIVIIAAVIVVLLIIAGNIHQCEECDKLYFGKKNTISFWGESENVCKDCYNDFYSWDW